MNNGLRVLRCINPDTVLRNYLDGLGYLEEIEDKQGKASLYFDDATPIPLEIADGIRHCTLRWVLFDQDNTAHYVTNSAPKAAAALKAAKPSFSTLVEIDDLPEADTDEEGAEERPARGRR